MYNTLACGVDGAQTGMDEALTGLSLPSTKVIAQLEYQHRVTVRSSSALGGLERQALGHRSPEERPALVGLNDGYQCGEIRSRRGAVVCVPLEVSAHPVELPHAS